MVLSPITLFVYNRPWHTRQTVESLQKNELADESDLIVFSDGEKTGVRSQNPEGIIINADDRRPTTDDRIKEVREYIKTINGFKSVRIVEREKNLGLANSIISGVTEVVNQYGRIIVLEDDMVTSPCFLRYMNDALDKYETDDRVICVHGYVFPIDELPGTFFIRGADCWGCDMEKRMVPF